MKNRFSLEKKVLSAVLLMKAPFLLAYDGPQVDYNFIYQEPSQYKICEQYTSLEAYKACDTAHDSAKSFASRFGGQEGKIEGYLRGYAWGLNKSVNASMNDAREMEEGARLVTTLDGQLQSGINAGIRAGQSDGNPRGAQDARQRFYAAVNTGKMPSRNFTAPSTSYQGENNAYAKYIGKIPTVDQILHEDSNLGELPIYGSFSDTLLRDREQRSPFYYWFANGTYRFETNHWSEGDPAFAVWTKRSGDQNILVYDRLVADPLHPVDPTSGKALTAIFKEAFAKTYEYYANFYFSVNFHQNIDQGQLNGEALGTQIGKRIARTTGLAKAFDKKFKESSQSSYRNAFVGAYSSSFESTYDDYANNPKITIDFTDVIGADNDGIIQPGENFGVAFKITNAGGKGTGLNISVSGNVQNSQTISNLSVGALSAGTISTEVIGQIDPRLSARETARITLNVNGVTDTFGQQVNQLVEIRGNTLNLNLLKGAGQVTVDATNVSTVQTPGSVSAELKLDGRTYNAIAGQLGAGATQRMVLAFGGLDPLELIKGRKEGVVTLRHNSSVLETIPVVLQSSNKTEDTISYFDQLANDKGTVPSNTAYTDRVEEVKTYLAKINSSEVDTNSKRGGRNMYRKDPESTVVGKIARTFTQSEQSDVSKDRYDSLAKIAIKERKKFKSFLGIAPKRSHYTKLVRVFAKNKKLK